MCARNAKVTAKFLHEFSPHRQVSPVTSDLVPLSLIYNIKGSSNFLQESFEIGLPPRRSEEDLVDLIRPTDPPSLHYDLAHTTWSWEEEKGDEIRQLSSVVMSSSRDVALFVAHAERPYRGGRDPDSKIFMYIKILSCTPICPLL